MSLRRSTPIAIAIAIAASVIASISSGTAKADSLLIDLGISHNGTVPTGSAPWLTADFESTTAGTVTLTIKNLMPTQEFTPIMLFNTTVNAANLHFTYVSGPKPTITAGATSGDPSIKAGSFDLKFEWPTANSDPNRFAGGTTVVETITDTTDNITAASFNSLSTGSQGGFLFGLENTGNSFGNRYVQWHDREWRCGSGALVSVDGRDGHHGRDRHRLEAPSVSRQLSSNQNPRHFIERPIDFPPVVWSCRIAERNNGSCFRSAMRALRRWTLINSRLSDGSGCRAARATIPGRPFATGAENV